MSGLRWSRQLGLQTRYKWRASSLFHLYLSIERFNQSPPTPTTICLSRTRSYRHTTKIIIRNFTSQYQPSNMSSQLPGRQSPDPERLTGSQQHDIPGSGKIADSLGARPAPEFAQQKSEENKRHSLSSNPPKNPLEKAEEAKYAK